MARLLARRRTEPIAAGVRLDEAMQASLVAATRYFASQNPADAESAKDYLQHLRGEIAMVATVAGSLPRLREIADALPVLAGNYESGVDGLIVPPPLSAGDARPSGGRPQAGRDCRPAEAPRTSRPTMPQSTMRAACSIP